MRRPQIAVIGPGEASPALADAATTLGRLLVDAGYRIICGGRGGVMEAVARGARRSSHATGGDVIGVLPSSDPDQANAFVDIVIPTGLGHARNAVVVSSADVVVAVGGKAGTLSELALAWTLGRPIVALVGHDGWADRVAGELLDDRRAEPIIRATSPREVVDAVTTALSSRR